MAWISKLTNRGLSLIANTLAGEKVTLTKARYGSGTVSESQLSSMTSLTNYKMEGSVYSVTANSGIITIGTILSNTNVDTSFNLNQIGIYANDKNGNSILFAVAQNTEAKVIPSKTDQPFYALEFNLNFVVSSATQFQANVPQTEFATIESLKEISEQKINRLEMYPDYENPTTLHRETIDGRTSTCSKTVTKTMESDGFIHCNFYCSYDSTVINTARHILSVKINGFDVYSFSDVKEYIAPMFTVKKGDTVEIQALNESVSGELIIKFLKSKYVGTTDITDTTLIGKVNSVEADMATVKSSYTGLSNRINAKADQTAVNQINANLSDKVGWAKVENGQLKLYADSAMTSLLQTLTLPSGGSSGGSTTDTNTTYTFSISGNVITITASDGTTQTITVPTGSGSGSSITVDSALSSTSTNPVQNKVVKAELDKKYEKPSSGIPSSDLASGVIPSVATTSNNGLMSSTDKTRLDTLTDSYIQSLVSGSGGGSDWTFDQLITIEEAVDRINVTLGASAKSVAVVIIPQSDFSSNTANFYPNYPNHAGYCGLKGVTGSGFRRLYIVEKIGDIGYVATSTLNGAGGSDSQVFRSFATNSERNVSDMSSFLLMNGFTVGAKVYVYRK